MKTRMSARVISLAAGVLALTCTFSHAAETLTSLSPAWEMVVQDDSHAYVGRHLVRGANATEVILAGLYGEAIAGGRKSRGQAIWIWRVGTDGRARNKITLPSEPDNPYADVEGVAPLGADKLVVVSRTQDRAPSVLRVIDARGVTIVQKTLEPRVRAQSLLPAADGKSWFLFGRAERAALVIAFDANGEELWRAQSDRDAQAVAIGGLVLADGGLIVAENVGTPEQFFFTNSTVWLVKYAAGGRKLFENSFKGRSGSIAESEAGSFIVCYDQSGTSKQSVVLRRVGPRFETLWESAVTANEFGLEPFSIGRANQHTIVFGLQSARPLVQSFGDDGQSRWSYSTDQLPSMSTKGLCAGQHCFLMSTVIEVGAQQRMLNKVTLRRFAPT